MEETSWLAARDLSELSQALKLVPRESGCLTCDHNTKLECPQCPAGQSCQYRVPLTCTECPKSVCLPTSSDDSSGDSSGSDGGNKDGGGSGGPSAGPIAGGVVGGIAVIAILTYLVWRYLIKPKRARSMPIYEAEANPARYTEKDAQSRITHRSSTHTVHSIASTVLTRASNIIQIAYIPGVTNRATPTSPTVLVPPVPPIPIHHSEGSRQSGQEDQHFFVPGNLRDSTYSGISNYTDRTSYARTSYAPRSSIASTIYGKQAQVQTPAQTGMRAKPTVVSVKSGSSPGVTPPLPSIDFEKFTTRPKSGASAFSVGSTFLNNANTATQARAQVVKVGGGLKKIEIGAKSDTSSSANSVASTPLADAPPPNSGRDSNAVTIIEDSPTVEEGPFSDPPERSNPQKPVGTPTLGAVIEDPVEETRDGERTLARPGSQERGRSPFGDEHATRE